jgi:hypothetical protein
MYEIVLLDFANFLNYKIVTFRKLDSASVFRQIKGSGKKTSMLGALIELASDLDQTISSRVPSDTDFEMF